LEIIYKKIEELGLERTQNSRNRYEPVYYWACSVLKLLRSTTAVHSLLNIFSVTLFFFLLISFPLILSPPYLRHGCTPPPPVCCSSSSSSQKSYILSISSLASSSPVPARTHGGLEKPQCMGSCTEAASASALCLTDMARSRTPTAPRHCIS
jgi:hypothetical protein